MSEMSDREDPYTWNKGYYRCDPCNLADMVGFAQEYCQACEEKLCKDCVEQHRSRKATSCHTLVSIQKLITTEHFICMQCRKNNKLSKPTRICIQYKVFLCRDCCELSHPKEHVFRTFFESPPVNFESLIPICDICKDTFVLASYVCKQCDEHLCTGCTNKHSLRKATKAHSLTQVSTSKNKKENQYRNVDESYVGRNLAVNLCTVCQEALCEHCTEFHRHIQRSTGHNIRPVMNKYSTCEQCELEWKKHKPDRRQVRTIEELTRKNLPGKPVASNVRADAVTLTWKRPPTFSSGNYYQLIYKEIDRNKYWKNFPHKIYTESAEVDGLRSNTSFVFRVRAVYIDRDGPLSVDSDKIVTLESSACRYTEYRKILHPGDPYPHVFAVPMKRNILTSFIEENPFEIGTRPLCQFESKTILLIGDERAGKSTLIDAILNYVLGVSWDDPYRFTVKQSKEEYLRKTERNTEMFTKYIIYPERGGRLPYTVHVIDTHCGLDYAEVYIEFYGHTDVTCFVIPASDVRLTVQQRRTLKYFENILRNKMENCICTLITFADGNSPPVLSALRESGQYFGEIFKFNNSSLFAKNENISSLSRVFWDMGFKSIKTFFDHIKTINTTNNEQKCLQTIGKKSQLYFVNGLSVASILEQSINDLKENQSLKDNYRLKNVPETFTIIKELSKDEIICSSCLRTTHYFSFKIWGGYWLLHRKQNCNVCKRSFPQTGLHIARFKFENVKIKTKYEEITKEDKDILQIVNDLAVDLGILKEILYKNASSLITCENRLRQIANLPESYADTNRYIEGMIEDEIRESNEGFLMRIYILYDLMIQPVQK